ncbi:hypothetical protein AB0I98_32190 [Streptomyces sp. NPDC050211]|uniref:hypothetical protein n=1 Tax=Streptomyces sp. NPDC050211 TaxID=3154932 RepID=UPI00341F0C2D
MGGTKTAAFAMVSGPLPALMGIAIVAGMVRGNLTLFQATAVTDPWGTTHFGCLSGLLRGYPGLYTAPASAQHPGPAADAIWVLPSAWTPGTPTSPQLPSIFSV